MVEVEFYEHPLATPERVSVAELGPWLLGKVPSGFKGSVSVYCDGRLLTEPRDVLAARGGVRVVCEPGAEAITWALVSKILVSVAISTALSFVIGALMRKDPRTGDQNRSQSSPNNDLGERDNRVRILERVEDIYGQVLSVPSLMMPSYRKYLSHRQVEYGYYCVGRGYYDVSDVKDGDTLVSEFSRASAAVYAPFTSPNSGTPAQQIGPVISDPIQSVKRSVQVDGATLKALNQLQILGAQKFDFEAPNRLVQRGGTKPSFSEIAEVGVTATVIAAPQPVITDSPGSTTGPTEDWPQAPQTVTSSSIVGRQVGDAITISLLDSEGNPTITGGFNVVSLSGSTAALSKVSGANLYPFSGTIRISYTLPGFSFTDAIETVDNRSITFQSQTFVSSSNRTATVTINTGADDAWTAWFTVNDPAARAVWVNIVAASGLYKDDGDGKQEISVAYELQVQSMEGGPTYNILSSLSGATGDERAETLEYALPFVGSFRVRMRRTTEHDYDFEGVVIDEIKWTDLYSVSPVNRAHFGNKTTIHTVTPATARATASRQRQLNCKAFRLLPRFDGATWSGGFDVEGRHTWGTIHPTARAIDAMAAMVQDPKIGARPLSDMDVAQVWQTQLAIEAWNPVCGEINYTFDSTDSSLEDMLGVVAAAVFSTAYRQSGRIRLFFERAQTQATALFSHRNKRPQAETITRSFSNANDYDGVEISYRDRDSTQSEVIRLPLDGSALRYKKMDLPGVTHFTSAWYRANREFNRLFHQRQAIETEVTGDGRLVTPGALVQIVDNTRMRSYDGEVLAETGLTLTLSQPVVAGVNPTIVLKRRDGRIESIPITAGPGERQVTLSRAPVEPVVTEVTADGGLRTEFSVADNDRRAAQRYLVQEISRSDGEYVRLTAVNYTDAYYSADAQPVPPKDSVINA